MYALRYLYRGSDEDEDDDSGYGMVGSVTFALFGEATADLTPLEVYALHCCQELRWNDDPRAPGELSIEAGLLILRQYNDDLET